MLNQPYPHTPASVNSLPPFCCSASSAWEWVDCVFGLVLRGHVEPAALANAVQHALDAELMDYICDRWGED